MIEKPFAKMPAGGARSLGSLAMALLIGLAVLGLSANSARAVVILDVVGGQLLGAQNVDVGGTLYDVAFVDGTCVAVFDGCDAVSDFAFSTNADATAAANALLNQVFLDTVAGMFDTDPELTNGCTGTFACSAVVPYALDGETVFDGIVAVNIAAPDENLVGTTSALVDLDLGVLPGDTFARFSLSETGGGETALPEPASWALLIGGIAALAGFRRRHGAGSAGQRTRRLANPPATYAAASNPVRTPTALVPMSSTA